MDEHDMIACARTLAGRPEVASWVAQKLREAKTAHEVYEAVKPLALGADCPIGAACAALMDLYRAERKVKMSFGDLGLRWPITQVDVPADDTGHPRAGEGAIGPMPAGPPLRVVRRDWNVYEVMDGGTPVVALTFADGERARERAELVAKAISGADAVSVSAGEVSAGEEG